ncbi:MAG: energy transducer TonB, partial [Pyrinomonadaceae bacterium]
YKPGGGGPGGSGTEVASKPQILSKPSPPYTEEARKNNTTGTVILRIVFGSNGQVGGIKTIQGLPFGLTENAIAAARQIQFIPAKSKDGHPVPYAMQIIYNYNLY